MESSDLVRQLLAFVHTMLEIRIDECPDEHLFELTAGAAVASPGAQYAHVVLVEDMVTAEALRSTPLFAAPEWRGAFGFEPQTYLNAEWVANLRYDLAAFRTYAQRVYARSDEFLRDLSPEVATRPAKTYEVIRATPGVQYREVLMPLTYVFMDQVTMHICEHTGEISAIVGLVRARTA